MLYKKWKHTDESIYSELDLQYHMSFLKKFISEHIEDEDCSAEKEEMVEKYYKKTMRTLEILMNQLNMMYYWEKIRIMFLE
jgi:hypothetical protein